MAELSSLRSLHRIHWREMIQASQDSLEELIQAEWDSIGDWGIMQRGIKK